MRCRTSEQQSLKIYPLADGWNLTPSYSFIFQDSGCMLQGVTISFVTADESFLPVTVAREQLERREWL